MAGEDESSWSLPAAQRLNVEFQKVPRSPHLSILHVQSHRCSLALASDAQRLTALLTAMAIIACRTSHSPTSPAIISLPLTAPAAPSSQAGVRGISLLYASGDEGANCKNGKFVPEGPGSSPYVTAVGGTELTAGYPKPV